LALFCALLVLAAGLVIGSLDRARSRPEAPAIAATVEPVAHETGDSQGTDAPWGELIVWDIQLEQPEEYLAFELQTLARPVWKFAQQTSAALERLLRSCGLTDVQIAQALAATSFRASGSVVEPSDDLVISLEPEVRARLYSELGRNRENHHMHQPFCYTEESFEMHLADGTVSDSLLATIRRLLYRRGDFLLFSDYETVMLRASESERMGLLKALSRQSAALARLQVKPETDIEPILAYWQHHGFQPNVRPLLESLQRSPEGGSVSFLHLMPPFARQRLYTFPLPPATGEPPMDCHWSTMNFFNDTPDNRFSDVEFVAQYVNEHYVQVPRPTRFGDVIFFLDENGTTLHSAVYLAGDLVFTKNGSNMAQPWIAMRSKELIARYQPAQVVVYRPKP
jgi:hypothetical protein